MKVRSFGIFYVMGSVFAKIKQLFDTMGTQSEAKKKSKKRAKCPSMKENSTEKGNECSSENDEDSSQSKSLEEAKMAKEKVVLLEEQIRKQKILMDEHQAKIVLLEQLIKRQCLILKENDDDNFTYEQLAQRSSPEQSDSLTFWDRVEKQLNSMIEKKEERATDNPDLAKIKYEFEAQRLQLQEHGECIKKHEEGLEDQLVRIETMREILDENSNHSGRGNGVKMILEDHEKRLTALEDRMALYEKQVEKRLAEQHQLLVFTWVGLITTFVLCFAIVCSCCWFR